MNAPLVVHGWTVFCMRNPASLDYSPIPCAYIILNLFVGRHSPSFDLMRQRTPTKHRSASDANKIFSAQCLHRMWARICVIIEHPFKPVRILQWTRSAIRTFMIYAGSTVAEQPIALDATQCVLMAAGVVSHTAGRGHYFFRKIPGPNAASQSSWMKSLLNSR
jgi:hypothetical protein